MYLSRPFALLLAVVFSAPLPNSCSLGVSAAGAQRAIKSKHAMQSMPPLVEVSQPPKVAASKEREAARKERARKEREAARKEREAARKAREARRAKAEMAAHELEVKKYEDVLKAAQLSADKRNSGVGSLSWRDRNPEDFARRYKAPGHTLRPEEAATLKTNEDKDMRSPTASNTEKALQMLDTLSLSSDLPPKRVNQLRYLFSMLSKHLDIYHPRLGKCIYIPDDPLNRPLTLLRLKKLARFFILSIYAPENIIALPPFHELFCLSVRQKFPMMWFLHKYIAINWHGKVEPMLAEQMAIEPDDFGPFAFDPSKRHSVKKHALQQGTEDAVQSYHLLPNEWIMRYAPRVSPHAEQPPDTQANTKWEIRNLSELVYIHSMPAMERTGDLWSDASKLDRTATKLVKFLFTHHGQDLLPMVCLGPNFQFEMLERAVNDYCHSDIESNRSMPSEEAIKKVVDWMERYKSKRVFRHSLR